MTFLRSPINNKIRMKNFVSSSIFCPLHSFLFIFIPIILSWALCHSTNETLILAYMELVLLGEFFLPPSSSQVAFSFVSKPRQKCWLWEIFIGCHLDKYENLIEYSPWLLVETKHEVAMDTGCLASAPIHQSLFSSTVCKLQMLPCIVLIISLDLLAKE